jgi:uncharacterized protein GlcG (DUF336 family)
MPRKIETLTLDDARLMISAGELAADALRIPYCLAVVDAGGHLLSFVRQDDAMIGCIDLAINKAYTARIFDTATQTLSVKARPGDELYGIQHSNGGKVVIFGGGLPIIRNGSVIGAVGVSAGTVIQDNSVAEAAIAALEPLFTQPHNL